MLVRNRKLLILLICMLTPATHALPVAAMFEVPLLESVPIERILTNLETQAKGQISQVDRAPLEFRIGRVHSMAYARKTELASVVKHRPGSTIPRDTPDYEFGRSNFKQFKVYKADGPEQEAAAKQHLQEALFHLNRAVALDPTLLEARMGLAWCLLQAGEKEKALPLFREVFKQSYPKESIYRGVVSSFITAEVASYLEQILDKEKDAEELSDIAAKVEQVRKVERCITPLLVPLCPEVSANDMLKPQNVVFDLEGAGLRRCSQWTGDKAGWLVYDADGSKKITSGLQLFGRRTFWIFWKNGYQALAALDDNQNGRIEGDELNGLAIWQDRNGNGESEPAEVMSLASLGIESLSCEYVPIENGVLRSKQGVRFRNGKTADTYDWILQTENY